MIQAVLLYPIFLFYWEILLKLLLRIPGNGNLYAVVLGCAALGTLIGALHSLLPAKTHRVLLFLFTTLFSFYFGMQLCLFRRFDFYFDWGILAAADQAMGFAGDMLRLILSLWKEILLILLPLLFCLLFRGKITFERKEKPFRQLPAALVLLLLYGAALFASDRFSNAFDLAVRHRNTPVSVENYGAVPSLLIDGAKRLCGYEDAIDIIDTGGEEETETSQNVITVYDSRTLDIDFAALAENETDKKILQLHEFFSREKPTMTNSYTGMFKGKNLILILGESFNEIAVRRDLTPTLYKLVHEGFEFTNFYTPNINSTIGGEMQELTALYNTTDSLETFKNGKNYYPFAIGRLFTDAGYSAYAYHNGIFNFQSRDRYLKAAGFENYSACLIGLEKKINCNAWPQSDMEMMEATADEYMDDPHFLAYYVTISGHGPYSLSGNVSGIGWKYSEYLKSLNLGCSDEALGYLASAIELDRAMEILLNKLEEHGRLEDTVIALVGDHYPYYLTTEQVNELSTCEKDPVIEIGRSDFILYNAGMEPVTIDKVGCQMDVMPTLYNLFDLPYDSRLLIGKDILSAAEGLTIFMDRSWVSDLGRYYSRSDTFEPKEGAVIPEGYVERMNAVVRNRAAISSQVINSDYYRYVFK